MGDETKDSSVPGLLSSVEVSRTKQLFAQKVMHHRIGEKMRDTLRRILRSNCALRMWVTFVGALMPEMKTGNTGQKIPQRHCLVSDQGLTANTRRRLLYNATYLLTYQSVDYELRFSSLDEPCPLNLASRNAKCILSCYSYHLDIVFTVREDRKRNNC